MIFRFTNGSEACQVLDMALEATFEGGKVIQSMFVTIQRTPVRQKALMYREGTSGKWLTADGISFNGIPRTPENLVRVVGGADPTHEVYVLPAL